MALKPQDLFVVLKLAAGGNRRPPYAQLARDLGMSASEVFSSVKRAQASGLLHGPALQNRPNLSAVEEFLVHGLKYVFPAEVGPPARGVPTSFGAKPLLAQVEAVDELPPVWPFPEGKQRGISLSPLYRTAPQAALSDPDFYELLVLADALRAGRARERRFAETELRRRLRKPDAKRKP
jgi:DNA-binding Lrp family transcriptional regulator